MSFFVDKEKKFVIYESPKTGGTTLRNWINYAATGELIEFGTEGYYEQTPGSYLFLHEHGYDYSEFKSFDGYETVCVKRDPVQRFVSCYTDKIIRENLIENCDLAHFIDNFDEVLENHPHKFFTHPSFKDKNIGYLWYHFVPQCYSVGKDINYYDHVIDTKEVSTKLKSFLESRWEIELPDIHARKQDITKINLTGDQVEKVKDIYKQDYNAGWC